MGGDCFLICSFHLQGNYSLTYPMWSRNFLNENASKSAGTLPITITASSSVLLLALAFSPLLPIGALMVPASASHLFVDSFFNGALIVKG